MNGYEKRYAYEQYMKAEDQRYWKMAQRKIGETGKFYWRMSKERFDNKIIEDRKSIKKIAMLAATGIAIGVVNLLLYFLK